MNLVALKEVQFMTNITIQYLSSFINNSQILSLNAKRMINLGYMNKKDKLNKRFSDVSNASNMDDMLIPEEFPEGSYGAEKNQHTKVEANQRNGKMGNKEQVLMYMLTGINTMIYHEELLAPILYMMNNHYKNTPKFSMN